MEETNRPLRILAVDDDEDLLNVYRACLSLYDEGIEGEDDSNPFDVFPGMLPEIDLSTCSSGEAAIAVIKKAAEDDTPFDIAFIDIQMPPGIDGITTAEEIRKIDPDILLSFVTSFESIHPAEIGQRVPPIDRLFFLKKPFHYMEIQQLAIALGARRQAEEKLRQMIQKMGL